MSSNSFLSALLPTLFVGAFVVAAEGVSSSCFDGTTRFTRDEWSHCHEIRPDLFMYYSPLENEGNLKLGLHAPNHSGGWSSLAIGGNGGMKGASQIVVRKEGGEWVAEDRNSLDYVTPDMDESQDVTLLFATDEDESGTSWGVVMKMNSCDEEDYPVEDRSTWMHWALGIGHDFTYHGEQRGQFRANLMQPSSTAATDDEDDLYTIDLRMPNVTLELGEGGEDPTNPYKCTIFHLENLMPNHDVSQKHHVVKFGPYLNPPSEKYVHHMIVFVCLDETATKLGFEHGKVIEECQSMPDGCFEMKTLWAVGVKEFVFPHDVGLPIGEGNPWLLLQMHYYNPGLDGDIIDSSGMSLYVSDTLRSQDAAVMHFNGGTSSDMRPALPSGRDSVTIPSFVVPPSCTNKWDGPVNVMGIAHHEHVLGKSVKVEVYRDGRNLGIMRKERHYDFKHQSLDPSSISQLLPGDEVVVTCKYDTSGRTKPTEFGDFTDQEMCYIPVLYYPKQSVSYFGYTEPPTEQELESMTERCTTGGSGDFGAMSRCAELYLTDVYELMGLEVGMGNSTSGALTMCNSDWYETVLPAFPDLCPPCYVNKTCVEADVMDWGQGSVCPNLCGEYGLSVYPDTSSVTPRSVTHSTMCGFRNKLNFDHSPLDPPACEVKGDLSPYQLNADGLMSTSSATAAGKTLSVALLGSALLMVA